MNSTILVLSTTAHREFAKTLNFEIRKHCGVSAISVALDDNCEGDFHSSNFFNACYNKICNIISILEKKSKTEGFLIYLDADICVRGNIIAAMTAELGDNHIAFQRDSSIYCAGMFICKICPEVLNFFNSVKAALISNIEYYSVRACDQGAINELLPSSTLLYTFLSDRFTTYGNIAEGSWSQSSPEFELSNDVLAFHANYTVGLENKTQLLKRVRSL